MNTNILMSTSISMCMSTNTLMKAKNMRMNMSTCILISTIMSTNTNIRTMVHPRTMNMSIRENMVRMTMNKLDTRKNLIPTIIDA